MTSRIIPPQTETSTLTLQSAPSMARVFLNVMLLSLARSQGRLSTDRPPMLEVRYDGIKPDLERVLLFNDVCGSPGRQGLPLVYPETLFIPMLGKLVTAPGFPTSPMGLIHTGQTIVQHRPINASEILDARCWTTRMEKTDKGVEIDCAIDLRTNQELVWEGVVTFLSRDARQLSRKKKKRGESEHEPLPVRAVVDVPENTGRRYAAASGDYNPHHLYRATARLLGFRQPIAHGMWSLARSVAEIEKTMGLQYPVRVEASFKLPIFMPSRVALGFESVVETETRATAVVFELTDERQGLPHLAGRLGFPS